jgi:zinc protease
VSASKRPAPGPPRPYEFPEVHRDRLANGVRVLVAPMRRLPLVTVLALVDAGASADPFGQEGVASLTARALGEGTAGLDGAGVAERLERLGTSFEASADWDSAVARITVTPDRLDAAFGLFAELVRAPTFPEADVARLRDERLADLQLELAEPRGLADRRFAGSLYTPTSRYARPAGGADRTVGRLDAAATRAFHARHFGPASTTLIFVGSISPEEARAQAEARFGAWKAPVTTPSPTANTAASSARRVVVVEKVDAPQTELRVGHVGVPRAHPEYLAIVVMNAILGGLFSSRINLNLRERNAFTYGASSGFDWRRGPGPFVTSTAVKSEVTDRATEEILREFDAIRETAPSPEEVSLATDYLAGVFPIRYESTAAVAGALAGATVFDLTEDWFRTYRDRVLRVTGADVLAAARVHLDPSRALVLAVGDPDVVTPALERLALGPLSILAAADDPSETK